MQEPSRLKESSRLWKEKTGHQTPEISLHLAPYVYSSSLRRRRMLLFHDTHVVWLFRIVED